MAISVEYSLFQDKFLVLYVLGFSDPNLASVVQWILTLIIHGFHWPHIKCSFPQDSVSPPPHFIQMPVTNSFSTSDQLALSLGVPTALLLGLVICLDDSQNSGCEEQSEVKVQSVRALSSLSAPPLQHFEEVISL